MKTKYYFLIFFFTFLTYGQESLSIAKVQYEMIFLTDSFDSELIYNNDKAVFTYSKQEASEEKTDDDGNINITIADTIPHIILNDLISKKLYHYMCVYSIKKHDWIEEEIPNFNWILIEETKKIGNLECSKAICTFRGRKYTAWYSIEIKSYFGPWKFSGLPGLILEVYDSENKIAFRAKKIDIPFNYSINVIPNNTISFDKVKQVQKEKTDELIKNIESKQERGFTVKIKVNTKEQIEKD